MHAYQKLKAAWNQNNTIPVLRGIVFTETRELIYDIPYAMAAVFLLWRLPYTIAEFRKLVRCVQSVTDM